MKLKTTLSILAVSVMLPMTCLAADATTKPAVQANAMQSEKAISEKEFIDSMAEKVLAVLKDKKSPFEQKQATLRELFTQTVDIDWIAKFVIGPAWKTATDEQKAKYIELYRTYLTESYISKFDAEAGSSVTAINVKSVKDTASGTSTAHTEIVQSGNEPAVKVDYLLRRKDGKIKVIDINIEGVSLLNTHRQEFNALAGSGGMEGVIKKLTELTTHKQQN